MAVLQKYQSHEPLYIAYKVGGAICAAALIPAVWLHRAVTGGDLDYYRQRLGIYPPRVAQELRGRPRLWMHAASVGEVGAAAAIMRSFVPRLPPHRLALSVTTEHGFARARALSDRPATCFFAPVDLDWSNRRALKMVSPDVLVLLETEIWPNLIIAAHRMGIPVVIANGRISMRTVKYYRMIKPLLRHILAKVDCFSMISQQDAKRIAALGAPSDRIVVNGNAKFDVSAMDTDPDHIPRAVALYDLKPDIPVFVAGSTRYPEERMILDAYQAVRRQFPKTLLIIAPRHIRRTEQIEKWVRAQGLACQRRSELGAGGHLRMAPVVVLDTIGELAATYAIATFVFCGGSLVPKGGQNLLEPAVWGKPVICGPSMEDFAEAFQWINQAGGCAVVQNHAEMAVAAVRWLDRPHEARAVGAAARTAVDTQRGAAARHAAVIGRYLAGRTRFSS